MSLIIQMGPQILEKSRETCWAVRPLQRLCSVLLIPDVAQLLCLWRRSLILAEVLEEPAGCHESSSGQPDHYHRATA